MKNTLLILSILFNILLITAFISYWYLNKSKIEYFNFVRNSHSQYIKKAMYTTDSTFICFLGNSITANWMNMNPDFFKTNNFLSSGIGGQTSSQILLRLQNDVISRHPRAAVLNIGINDIGQGDGFYYQSFTIQNIQSIIDVCKVNNIDVILTSVLPATQIKKNIFCEIENVQAKIEKLNIGIEELASINTLKYVDYSLYLKNSDGTFNNKYTFDGIHPNKEGYEIMENVILKAINN